MFNFLKKQFNFSYKYLKKIDLIVKKIEKLKDDYSKFKDEDFPKETERLKKLYQEGTFLDDLLIEAFALSKEACKRVTGLDPYKVQLLGSFVLYKGKIAEMKTGEGKTLTSVMSAYLHALSGKGVHIVTVNEYLASRESEGEIGDVFRFLGMTVGLNTKEKNIEEKKIAYNSDIMYSTHSELGFDYLRDNIETNINNILMKKEYNYVIVDEVDSILIDEARTPLIISSKAQKSIQFYRDANRFVKILKETHYIIEPESKTIELTEEGIKKAETFFQIKNLYNENNSVLLHCIKNALKAFYTMSKNKDYLVDNNKILIIDSFTGRVLKGRKFSDGLHQALEAKEGCDIEEETEISATITYQNFFRIYKILSGMTGTAKTEEKEFINIYNTRVIEIPTNKKIIREDAPDFVFATLEEKWESLIEDIEERHKKQQPILIGTVTVEVSELISQKLKKRKIKHELLNAKYFLKEAEIISKAGQKGSITIATNMAGRGTDIQLGEGVAEIGGLAVLGTERHESRRIDNQLRGRSGRQGDPGFSRFFVSGEDDLVKRFGSDKIQRIIELLNKTRNKSDEKKPISFKFFTNFFTKLQKKIENSNFNYRKFILQFDSVLGLQREIIYQQRKEILNSDKDKIEELVKILISKTIDKKINYFLLNKMNKKEDFSSNSVNFLEYFEQLFFPKDVLQKEEIELIFEKKQNNFYKKEITELILNKVNHILEEKKEKLIIDNQNYYSEFLKIVMIRNIDNYFKRHISDMNILSKSINFMSYGQQNVLTAYQEKSLNFFNEMINNISFDITRIILKFTLSQDDFIENNEKEFTYNDGNVTKNILKKSKKRKYKAVKKPWN
ncbi:preprotein translocase subunit SecA [Candidatus Phytoplasma luffae]|uniref:preprotein translocase subunit SecA n=1 Tax=Loofah witches'-broom phytoplasma TaxID=35773 RepID=UPI001B372D2C|nr:preprotein translocase subunit SecA [Candidatus Phytoplasma luffae]